MIRKIIFSSVILLAVHFCDASAQNSQVLYYMNLPQNHMLNPALRPTNSVYIGLPVISGINVNINNNFFNFSDVFIKGVVPDSVVTFLHPDYDPAKFMAKIKDVNSIEPEALVQLFGLGFSAGKDLYISLDINERVNANFALPGDLLRLGFEGNEQFVGSKIDLSSFRADMKYYREIALGFSKNFSNNLRIGARGKVLFGIASASVDNRSFGISVNDDYTHAFTADLTARFSAPITFHITGQNNIDSVSFDESRFEDFNGILNYMLETSNMGLGLDIGAEYRITDRLKVSAAVTDLGYIRWKRDITNLKAESEFLFSGIDLFDVYQGDKDFDEVGEELLDSLKNSFYLTDTSTPFTTNLPFGVTLGGSYNLTKGFSIGVLSYTRFVGSQIREALTLSANVNVRSLFSTTVAYTVMNHRNDNLGFGIAFKPGWFQFYLLADRIPVTWNKIVIDGSTIPLPYSWNTIHLRLGMNLAFGNREEKKKDKPMLELQE